MTSKSYGKRPEAKTIKSIHWKISSLEMKGNVFSFGSKEKLKAALPRRHHKMHYPLLLKWTLLNKVKGEFISCSLENKSVSAKTWTGLFTCFVRKSQGFWFTRQDKNYQDSIVVICQIPSSWQHVPHYFYSAVQSWRSLWYFDINYFY